MDPLTVLVVLQKELRDALRNRWLWGFALAFGLLAASLGALGLTRTAGALGFSRAVAGLVNLSLLLVPLVGLALGVQSLAGERERGTLSYLLAQPVGRTEVLLGKYLGLALALGATVALGFGVAGIALAWTAVDARAYAAVAGLALLLGFAALSLGTLLSVPARRTIVALGSALLLWFVLVLLADLGLMGTALVLRLRAQTVFLLALANPLQVFKLAAVLAIQPDLEVLGPAGLYGTATFGAWLGPLLVSLLAAWVVAPLAAAAMLFARQGEP